MVTTRRSPYAPTETIVEPTLIQFPDEFPLTDELLMQPERCQRSTPARA